jgi:hypothetical protein
MPKNSFFGRIEFQKNAQRTFLSRYPSGFNPKECGRFGCNWHPKKTRFLGLDSYLQYGLRWKAFRTFPLCFLTDSFHMWTFCVLFIASFDCPFRAYRRVTLSHAMIWIMMSEKQLSLSHRTPPHSPHSHRAPLMSRDWHLDYHFACFWGWHRCWRVSQTCCKQAVQDQGTWAAGYGRRNFEK